MSLFNKKIWIDIEQPKTAIMFQSLIKRFENEESNLLITARDYEPTYQILDDNDISQGAAFGDLNADGYPDLYVCNWFEPDLLLINNRGNYFESLPLPITHLTQAIEMKQNLMSRHLSHSKDPEFPLEPRITL